MVTIYALADPRNSKIRYVGCSIDPKRRRRENLGRARRGVPGAMPEPHRKWLLSLDAVGMRPSLRVLAIVEKTEAAMTEKRAIALFRRLGEPILNECDGGLGIPGYRHRPEIVARFATSMKGKPKSESHRAALAVAAHRRTYSESELAQKRQHMNRIRHLVKPRRGEEHSRAKLTYEIVSEVRKRYASGGCTHRSLGREYGVSAAAIRFAITGRTWASDQPKNGTSG